MAGSRVLTLEEPTSPKIYSILISKDQNKSSDFYFENLFDGNDIDREKVYILPCIAKYNTYMQSYQYKLVNNILFLDKKFYIFRITSSPLCSFYKLCNETPLHIFYECPRIKCLSLQLVQYFQNI